MSVAIQPDKKYTYADYLTWPDDERWELIEGIPYAMSPAPGMKHQSLSMDLSIIIGSYLKKRSCKVFAAPFDVLLCEQGTADEEIKTVVQPDLVVICDLSKLNPKGCKGAPDLVIEILSESTAYKDQTKKLRLYEKHGVKEYWIVSPDAEYIMIYSYNGQIFDKPRYYIAGDIVRSSVLTDLSLDLRDVFASA